MTAATAARPRRGKAARLAREREALEALAWAAAPPLELPAGIELQWLGTSGFRISAEGTTLLVDPYATRSKPADVLARRRPLASLASAVEQHLPRADAVLVGHTHFDHALDVPAVVRRDAAKAYGSDSLVALMGLHGLAGSTVRVEPYLPYEIGPFTVTFVPSRHSRLLAGLKVPSGGELTCDHLDGLTGGAYHCGQVFGIHIEVAGTAFYHQGSADLLADERIPRGVDIFLCGIAGRMFSPRYLDRILTRLEPHVVVPHHWDDFFTPLERPLGFSFNVRLHRFPEEVAKVSRSFEVRTLRPLQTIAGRYPQE